MSIAVRRSLRFCAARNWASCSRRACVLSLAIVILHHRVRFRLFKLLAYVEDSG
jgi:hypothetical protein